MIFIIINTNNGENDTRIARELKFYLKSRVWFCGKYDESGEPQKYEASLVARGFSQEYLINYNEIFVLVARIETFRFIGIRFYKSI